MSDDGDRKPFGKIDELESEHITRPISWRSVRKYMTADEAQLARVKLESMGIAALVRDDQASRSLIGLGARDGVHLDVDEPDLERAAKALDEVVEVSAEERAAHPELAGPESRLVVPAGKDAASRAFRASIIGLIVCPGILHLYSAWMLRVTFREWATTDDASKRTAVLAMIINVAAIVAVIVGVASIR